ncbi:MAG: hypothetical protein ACO3EF_09655 [Vulcanococcus sp.]
MAMEQGWFSPLSRHGLAGAALLGAVLVPLVAVVGLPAARAAVLGAAPARPLNEAVASSRRAAEAVLAREGRESCLIGKLTNALLGLSSSCEASGAHSPLCALADRAAATTRWSMDFTDATARSVLELSGRSGSGSGSGAAASGPAAELQSTAP